METQEENRTPFLTAGLDCPCYPQPVILTEVPDFFHELYKKLTNEEGFDFYSPWQTPDIPNHIFSSTAGCDFPSSTLLSALI